MWNLRRERILGIVEGFTGGYGIDTLTRRAFLGGVAASAAWPRNLLAAPGNAAGGKAKSSAWERPDGTATDSMMARRLYLDLAGRIPTRDRKSVV